MRNRVSWQLSEGDCRKLMQASDAAFAAGMPLNRFITIAWVKGGLSPSGSVHATGSFIKRSRDWLKRHGYLMPWLWVQESGIAFGQHCHILLHVDPLMDDLFGPMPLRWVKGIVPGKYVAGTLQSQKLSTARFVRSSPLAYQAQLEGKLHYIMKAAPVRLEEHLGMIGKGYKHWGQFCCVYGKRAGVWQR